MYVDVYACAQFAPTLADPPAPALDLYDLDEHFANERVRLAQLANKCVCVCVCVHMHRVL